jgi:hypothetical protein
MVAPELERPTALLCWPAMKGHAVLCVVVLLAACGSKPQAPPPAARAAAQPAATPPSDPNLVNAPIPALLLEAQRAPYAEPADGTCAGITAQVLALDALLGADLDVPPTAANPSLIERGAGGGTQRVPVAGESVVPVRSWVRRPSGAERYSPDVAAAIAAGGVRRSYLKGIGAVRGCRPPAAPNVHP